MINYNFLEKFVHDLILGNNFIKSTLYDLEKFFFLEKKNSLSNNSHVFICGLPRSGTTILLNYIYKSNLFGSLTYGDMPFILAPNCFKKFNFNKTLDKRQRFHEDDIFIDLYSPEALDETFLKMYKDGNNFNEYRNYINLILKRYEKKRYLSKNNNNFKRLEKIDNLFPESKILICFRDPIQQSYSLWNQNNNFLNLNKQSKFSSRYMRYIGHYEFGINHKAWFIPKIYEFSTDVNYWLEQWILFYDYILEKSKKLKNYRFICYENLSSNDFMYNLNKLLDIQESFDFKFKNSNKDLNLKLDKELKEKSIKIYNKLKSASIGNKN